MKRIYFGRFFRQFCFIASIVAASFIIAGCFLGDLISSLFVEVYDITTNLPVPAAIVECHLGGGRIDIAQTNGRGIAYFSWIGSGQDASIVVKHDLYQTKSMLFLKSDYNNGSAGSFGDTSIYITPK